jgi:hypothetical protein
MNQEFIFLRELTFQRVFGYLWDKLIIINNCTFIIGYKVLILRLLKLNKTDITREEDSLAQRKLSSVKKLEVPLNFNLK